MLHVRNVFVLYAVTWLRALHPALLCVETTIGHLWPDPLQGGDVMKASKRPFPKGRTKPP